MMAVIPGVPSRATWRAVPTSTPVLQLVLVILEKKSTNNPFIAFTNTAGQTFNGTTSQRLCVSASLEQFFCTWLSHSSSLERARSEVVTWCCGVLLHPALEWPKLRFETTHSVETLRVSHPILLYFFFLFFIFISSRSTIGSCWIARYFFLSFFFFRLQLVRLIERFGMRTIDHDYYIGPDRFLEFIPLEEISMRDRQVIIRFVIVSSRTRNLWILVARETVVSIGG